MLDQAEELGMAAQAESGRAGLVADTRMMVNVVTAYARVRFRLFTDRFHVDWPQTALGVIPVGRAHLDLKLGEIRSIGLTSVVFPSRLVVVGALFFAAVYFEFPAAVTVLLGVLTSLFVLLSFVVAVRVENDRDTVVIPVCWLQRRRALDFVELVREQQSSQDPIS